MGFLCWKCMVFTIKQLQVTVMNVILISCSNILFGLIIYLKVNGLNCTIKSKTRKCQSSLRCGMAKVYVSLVIAISKTIVIFFKQNLLVSHHLYIEMFFFFPFCTRVLSQNDNRMFVFCISLFK